MSEAEISVSGSRLRLGAWYDGDYLVSLAVESDGFSGHASGHVVREDFEAFSRSLDNLASTRKTSSSLTTISSEIELLIEPVDSLGHLGAFGKVLLRRVTSDTRRWDKLVFEFAFEFDPSMIERFAKQVRAMLSDG